MHSKHNSRFRPESILKTRMVQKQITQLSHCPRPGACEEVCRNVEGNATSQIWKENLRNPCDSASNLNLQTRGGQVANARWDKTGSCRATNEGEWVTPTSEASPGVHYSKKHPFVVISIEKNWVIWLQSKIPSSWGVRSPDPHHSVGRGTWLGHVRYKQIVIQQ